MKLENALTGTHPLQNEKFSRQMSAAKDKVAEKKTALHDEEVINTDKVRTVVDKLNEFTESLRTDLKFEYHEKLNEYYVTVVNPLTDEVIKEIPPKNMLDMYAAMAEFMGILVDEKI
ncbi:flagellar protein FlaG [Virgibacillus litoralis]|uniref:Flagellar protein FlaG n=1 Tax=Virgibacillus litoralis TaxID=578221 RepID=A0ABS4HAP2_9BACI|nr:flagellar protein FlaG [Virgibacillus litoralis]MBP1947976.1 flagellar protein FlaG [Virgibacillus litoralis]